MHQSLFLINNWINEKLIIFLNISNTLITVVDWKIWLKEKIEMNRIDIRLIKNMEHYKEGMQNIRSNKERKISY